MGPRSPAEIAPEAPGVGLAHDGASGPGLTRRQQVLRAELVKAIRAALPAEAQLDSARVHAHSCYRTIAEVLVDLRHACPGPGGEQHDLRGRSAAYRAVVREAYAASGSDTTSALPKRLTSGVAYWVRKLLTTRYGEERLHELGVLRGSSAVAKRSYRRPLEELPEDPGLCLDIVVQILNALAIDPVLIPNEEAVRSAARAVLLLRQKLAEQADVAQQDTEEDEPHLAELRHPAQRRSRSGLDVAYRPRARALAPMTMTGTMTGRPQEAGRR